MLTELGEKDVLMIMVTKNAEFVGNKESQLRNCAEINSTSVKGNSGKGKVQPPTTTHSLKKPGPSLGCLEREKISVISQVFLKHHPVSLHPKSFLFLLNTTVEQGGSREEGSDSFFLICLFNKRLFFPTDCKLVF